MHLQLVWDRVQMTQPLKMWIWKKKFDLKNAWECPKFLENQFLQKKILKKKYDEFIAHNVTQTSLE